MLVRNEVSSIYKWINVLISLACPLLIIFLLFVESCDLVNAPLLPVSLSLSLLLFAIKISGPNNYFQSSFSRSIESEKKLFCRLRKSTHERASPSTVRFRLSLSHMLVRVFHRIEFAVNRTNASSSKRTRFYLVTASGVSRLVASHFNCCRFGRPHFQKKMLAHLFSSIRLITRNVLKFSRRRRRRNRSTERNELNVRNEK